jgi:hypothetical protein
MKVKEYNSHDFEYLDIEMNQDELAEMIEKLSKMLRNAMRGEYNCGFYGQVSFNFDKDDGYPSYLNKLNMQVRPPKKKK